MLSIWLRCWSNRQSSPSRRRPARIPIQRRSRPTVEALEDRRLPSVFTVTNTANSGDGSLRQAILNANSNPGTDTIHFSIGTGHQRITPASVLPAITDPVILDATSQPGYAGAPLIELYGASAGAGVTGLTITGGGSTVLAINIDHFTGDGIDLTTNGGDTIQGSYLGSANGGNGILVTSAGNTIAGNVISGNTGNGVDITGSAAAGNVVRGNLIGTTPTGLAALPNGGRGVFIDRAPNNTIGGTTAADRNVISGTSGGVDILIDNSGADGNLVEGNYIGLAADGASAVPSTGGGIRIGNAANNNTIGGTAAGAGNVISGNPADGVLIDDWDGDASVYTGVAGAGNAILGNIIGLNADGTAAVPNGTDGIQLVHGASNSLIVGNVISGNSGDGIVLSDAGTKGNTVQGNLIGLNAAGSAAFANARHGIEIINGAASNLVGPGNVISGNNLSGIYINGPTTSNNAIQGNVIGTNPAGTVPFANGAQGHLTLDEQGIKVENAANDTIGGTTAGAANVIAGNSGNGIFLAAGTNGIVIQGNFIGTNASSAANLGNGADGIRIDSSSSNTLGGTATGAGNVISGNGGNGITLLAHVGSTPPFTPGSNDPGGLTLTSAGVADGFKLSTFIDKFPPNTIVPSFGPFGMVFPSSGGFLADDGPLGTVYQFTMDKDNQPVTAASTITNTYGALKCVGIAQAGSALYMAQSINQGSYVREITPVGAPGPIIISSLPTSPYGTQNAEGLVANPVNGHLFLSTGGGGQIYDINPQTSPATLTLFATNLSDPDGLTITPDGSTLYVAENAGANARILAYDVPTKTLKTSFPATTVGYADGITLGSGALAGYLFVNTNNGRVVMMSAADPSIQQVIASEGSRGDFAIVDPSNDSVLLTQTDRIDRLTLPTAGNASNNVIQGNLIGTNVAGTVGLSNAGDGIDVLGGAHNNTIGGTAAGAGNVISGNAGDGVSISGNASSGNVVQGCLIGTTASGLAALGNLQHGVFIDGAPNNSIGGTTAAARNVISGNGTSPVFAGILIANQGATGNVVAGNSIAFGTDGTTTAGMANTGQGVRIGNAANNNTIGGTASGAGNLIGANGGDSVVVDDFDGSGNFTGVPGVDNSIRGNSIVNTTSPNRSIHLVDGGNHAQAAPVLASASTSGGTTTVTGSLTSEANTSFILEFFSSAVGSPLQGRTFLGNLTVTTDGTGQASFTASLPVAVTPGEFATATATNTATNDTSEFSSAMFVGQPPAFTSVPSATFTVGTAGGFTLKANGVPAPTLSESGGDVLPGGVAFYAATGLLSGTPAVGSGGVYTLHFTAHNGIGANVTQTFILTVVTPQAPTFTSAGSTTFTVGYPGNFTVAASGYPAPTLSESSTDTLPGGVTFISITRLLSGTPAAGSVGTYTLHFTATNGVGSDATQTFTLTVDQPPAFTSTANTTLTAGAAGSFTVAAVGSPPPTLSESAGDTLPNGVAFDATTGVLGGTPAAGSGGSYTLHFTAHNGAGSDATQTFTFIVDQAPALTIAGGVTFTAGTAGSFHVAASGFPVPVLTESSSDTLPSGVSFDPVAGVLSGTPAPGSVGTYTLHFTATNGLGADATQTFTLTVDALPLRDIVAKLIVVKVRKKKRLAVQVSFADTGAPKGQFFSPFQKPAFRNIKVSVRDSNGDGVPDQVVLTARKGKKTVTATFPG
jgi:parallel beta-helix repeat protein